MKKLTLKISCALALAALVSFTSCDSSKRATRNKPTSSSTAVAVAGSVLNKPASTSTNTNSTTDKSNKNQGGGTLPTDRKALHVNPDTKAYSPEEFKKGILKGDWAIETVDGQKAVGETTPFIKFSESDHRVYGNNGCNTINATYSYDPKDMELTFSNTIVTMRLCAMAGITDIQINNALNDTRKYSLEETNDGYNLYFYNSKGKEVMRLTHQNLDFLNGTWRVASIDGNEINVERMKLVFDVDENKVHGNTGCNVLNGRLETNLESPNTFSFEGLMVTMMTCPEIEYQQAMLVALEEACSARPISKDEVMLLDADGENVMTLVRTSDK